MKKIIYKYTILTISFILVDQSIKNYVVKNGDFERNRKFFIDFNLSYNNTLFLIIIVTIITITIFFLILSYFKIDNYKKFWIIVFVISGMFSNLIDRVYKKSVIDYIYINNKVFNLADIFVAAGILLLILIICSDFFISRRSFYE